jgi:hypothetical protein
MTLSVHVEKAIRMQQGFSEKSPSKPVCSVSDMRFVRQLEMGIILVTRLILEESCAILRSLLCHGGIARPFWPAMPRWHGHPSLKKDAGRHRYALNSISIESVHRSQFISQFDAG